MIFYTYYIYVENNLKISKDPKSHYENSFSLILIVVNLIPAINEIIYIKNYGLRNYIKFENIMTALYLFGSIGTGVIHFFFEPRNFISKISLIIVILLSMFRTFKLMKIFDVFSPIATMLINVINDL